MEDLIKGELDWHNKVNENFHEVDSQMADYVNVKLFGAKGDGTTDDTNAIQNAINSLKEGKTLRFPSGTYLTKELVIPNDLINVFSFEGNNSKIMYIGTVGKSLLNRKISSPRESIYFRNLYFVSDDTNYRQSYFLFTSGNSSNLYPFIIAENCRFDGWITCFGGYAEIDNGGENDNIDNTSTLGQCRVNLFNCTFYKNIHAVSQCIDSVINKCTFSLNDYGIVLRKYGFANRITDNRLEWNTKNGIYIYQGAGLIANNEFDRNGYAGLNIQRSNASIVIGNKFLRNGAYENQDGTGSATNLMNNVQNVHIYADSNYSCTFIGNTTREDRQWDNGTGDVVPLKCSTFTNNNSCTIIGNNLCGGYIKYTDAFSINYFYKNLYCIVKNSMYQADRICHKKADQDYIVKVGELQYMSFKTIDQIYDDMIMPHKLIITTIINSLSVVSHEIPFYLFKADNNSGYVKGNIRQTIGADNTPFELKSINYFRNSGTFGVNLHNNTSTDNRYLLRFE